ncbi:MAG: hypothetical protein GY805_05055 [Chloroflexi bacterium]|nr:hypothetical protein [Chloroflexota bacterium]
MLFKSNFELSNPSLWDKLESLEIKGSADGPEPPQGFTIEKKVTEPSRTEYEGKDVGSFQTETATGWQWWVVGIE